MSEIAALQLDPSDEVVILLGEGDPGAAITLTGGSPIDIALRDHVPFGHKVAIRDLAAGTHVRKYGIVIGITTQTILAGQHVHEHNLRSLRNGPRG